ncbi:MAG: DUF3551 domain-containing protein [Xanthobacteraceae bacterium]
MARFPEREIFKAARLLPRLIILAVVAGVFATRAAAQNYPWCSNFADGAGTNCGYATEAQCRITVQGSGGYCDHNNLYQRPATAGPAQAQTVKHHGRKS